MQINFISLASGSSGNCFYIGTDNCRILIDAGIAVRTIKKRLHNAGLDLSKVCAVFITHDHIDHIKSAGVLSEKLFLPVFTTAKTHNAMDSSYIFKQKIYSGKRIIEKNLPVAFDDFTIEAFGISHDGCDSVGYTVHFGDKRFTLITDLGYICETAKEHIINANYLVIEANYDEQMLDSGKYPLSLKQRIQSDTGHLSNRQTAKFLSDNINEKLSHIWLCHLSRENNLPQLAYKTVNEKLKEKGINVNLYVLPRTAPSDVFVLEN
ncbi:MAG: MBL fold metallo-hydrolase [Prevotellaceae bacterium]|jgi:phosphoribosyl 1,2-cyclic phosphodiesterase|nr:MBL fold metallo-hydrolase [Prevotellaceae bacterium]